MRKIGLWCLLFFSLMQIFAEVRDWSAWAATYGVEIRQWGEITTEGWHEQSRSGWKMKERRSGTESLNASLEYPRHG